MFFFITLFTLLTGRCQRPNILLWLFHKIPPDDVDISWFLVYDARSGKGASSLSFELGLSRQ